MESRVVNRLNKMHLRARAGVSPSERRVTGDMNKGATARLGAAAMSGVCYGKRQAGANPANGPEWG